MATLNRPVKDILVYVYELFQENPAGLINCTLIEIKPENNYVNNTVQQTASYCFSHGQSIFFLTGNYFTYISYLFDIEYFSL